MFPVPPPLNPDLKRIQDKLSASIVPWQRSFHFWVRTANIYAGYKAFQFRVSFVKDVKKQQEMWELQHELAAHKIYSLCSDLGGFFLKVAQIIGKPDLAPAAWVKRLVTLCDRAPATPYHTFKLVVEGELGQSMDDVFDRFDLEPLGSASIAQVHKARLKGDDTDVVVKVQHPGVEDLMMTDIRNLQAFAYYMQKTDVKFDLYSITKEMEKQIGYEFDFAREADAMHRIRSFLYGNSKKSPVLVPRVIKDMVTRRVLVALLDYGQVKDLPNDLRLGYAELVLAMADNDPLGAKQSYKDLGIKTLIKSGSDENLEMLKLAQTMFDSKLPPGVDTLQPFSEDSSLKKLSVQAFPEELFSILRTVHLLRGLSVGLGLNYSCAEQWRPIAEEALYAAGRLKDRERRTPVQRRGFLLRLLRRKE
ncbi:Protein ACTIVITY OF BC1 COMPLEX KINASE 8, chloroplastic [Linum perenne]